MLKIAENSRYLPHLAPFWCFLALICPYFSIIYSNLALFIQNAELAPQIAEKAKIKGQIAEKAFITA